MMRIFGLLGVLVALLAVGLLVKKQLTAVTAPLPALQAPAAPGAATAPVTGNAAQQSQQIQQQFKQAVEGAMQAPRNMPEDK